MDSFIEFIAKETLSFLKACAVVLFICLVLLLCVAYQDIIIRKLSIIWILPFTLAPFFILGSLYSMMKRKIFGCHKNINNK